MLQRLVDQPAKIQVLLNRVASRLGAIAAAHINQPATRTALEHSIQLFLKSVARATRCLETEHELSAIQRIAVRLRVIGSMNAASRFATFERIDSMLTAEAQRFEDVEQELQVRNSLAWFTGYSRLLDCSHRFNSSHRSDYRNIRRSHRATIVADARCHARDPCPSFEHC